MNHPPPPATYLRRLTLFDTAMMVVSGIIGGGIFLTPAVVAERAGSASLVVFVWIVGGVVALSGALCFAELGSRRPEAGSVYVCLREVIGPLPAFLYGWTALLVVNTGSIAGLAMVFAQYLADLLGVPASALPAAVPSLAIGAILVLSVLHYVGIRTGATTLNVLTVLKLAALAALIVIGLAGVHGLGGAGAATAVVADAPAGEPGGWWPPVRLIGIALIPVVFSYGGWNHVTNVAGEIRQPERTIPRAMVLGIAGVLTVYLLVNVALLGVLGTAGLAKSAAPATDAVRLVLGPQGGVLIGVGVALSTLACAHMMIVAAPRVLQRLAADGLFFAGVAALHPSYHTPHRALLLQAGWAALLVLSGTYGQLLDYVTFGDWIFLAMIVATVFAYHRRDARDAAGAFTGYRVTGYPVVPSFFIVAAAFIVVSVVLSGPRNALYGALIIAAGVPAFALWRRRTRALARAVGALPMGADESG
ncbi:MAG TPA: amino acid permease [Methylomirabilota bacterium]|jgi:APA family basic amino acid/polyamine antiporter|nr:amino acid permease [Methylomirabilota bacterium]